jgi:hypothetical protein
MLLKRQYALKEAVVDLRSVTSDASRYEMQQSSM